MSTTSDKQSLYHSSMRPSEKVLHFFEQRLREKHALTGSRLPTIKEIAAHLGVGISTVQAVFARLGEQGRVVTIQGRGTFIANVESVPVTSSTAVTVVIQESQLTGKESTWGKEICSAMLCEATNTPTGKLSIHPFFPEINGKDLGIIRKEVSHSVAAIVFPDPLSQPVSEAFYELGKPVIHITPQSPTTTENFVGPDFYRICNKIGHCWRSNGRAHVVVILHAPLEQSATCSFSLSGFQGALQGGSGHSDVKLSYRSLPPSSMEDGVTRYLEELYREGSFPDAIYATGDFFASRAVEWLLNRGIKVPEEVSVIGGTGLHPAHDASVACTVVQQPFERIGQEAIRMAVSAVQNGGEPLPGKFLEVAIRIGRTTTESENFYLTH